MSDDPNRRDEPAPDGPPMTDRRLSSSPYDPDDSLSDDERRVEDSLPTPKVRDTRGEPASGYKIDPAARFFVRGPWEMAASILIGVGVVMLMQPFFLWLYTYSFIVILIGTVGFIIVSHFPEGD